MADSASESDSSSIDGGPLMMPPSPVTREQLQKRIDSLQQQNRVLKVELETFKLRVKGLQEENRALRQASVTIQAKAEQEEEYISNTLLKKIQALKKEKETLAHHYEQEEECLTNDLSRKLNQLRQEKCRLEQTLEQEQECLVNKLMRKIEKLEAETLAKQSNLEQLRREKVELENTLEQEQEALVNRLWKRMDKLEAEKRMLQIKLDQPVSDPASPREIHNGDAAANLSSHIQNLRSEVTRLRYQLATAQQENTEVMQHFQNEERTIREENLRLHRKLQLEVERREALCRHLSESESSLEMEEERHYNEMSSSGGGTGGGCIRSRAVSSPVPYNPSPSSSRPLSPGIALVGSTSRDSLMTPNWPAWSLLSMNQHPSLPPLSGNPISNSSPPASQLGVGRRTSDLFIKPAIPPSTMSVSPNSSLLPSSASNHLHASPTSPSSVMMDVSRSGSVTHMDVVAKSPNPAPPTSPAPMDLARS